MVKYAVRLKKKDGFTLIELMVALVISSIVIAAIFMTFNSQHKSYVVQDRVSDMHQNIRAAMYFIEREIRMAGCDPLGNADAAITAAGPDSLSFSMDIRGASDGSDPDGDTGDANEQVTFALDDPDGDGVDNELDRNSNTIAENIDALSFVYLDEGGDQLSDIDGDGSPDSIDDIRSIQVTLVARTEGRDVEFNNNNTYQIVLPDGTLIDIYTANDNVRRRMLTTRVRCRNLGL
jgi:type IV pilus assembly protein PilW